MNSTLTTQATRVSRALALGALACAGAAHSAITFGPAGNLPFGAVSAWQNAGGWASDASGLQEWVYGGAATESKLVRIDGGAGSVVLDHTVNVQTAGGIKLSAAASATANMAQSYNVYAHGSSTAVVNDIVTVQSGGNLGLGTFISFGWETDGTLLYTMQSTNGQSLTSRGSLFFAQLARAESFVSWAHPLTGQVSSTVTQLGMIELRNQNAFDAEQLAGLKPILGKRMRPDEVLNGFHLNLTMRLDVDTRGTFLDLVPAPVGQPVEVTLGLASYFNVVWDQLDFTNLQGGVYADFGSTAKLVSVQLHNEDGSLFVGDWTLQSANGFDYPESILSAPIPEPGTWALMLVGLAAVSGCSRLRGKAAV